MCAGGLSLLGCRVVVGSSWGRRRRRRGGGGGGGGGGVAVSLFVVS